MRQDARQPDRADGDTGYLHGIYAASFAGAGQPRELPHCGGWIIERRIPGSELLDGMGCYPVFTCRRWARLACDLPALAERLVSLVLVTDPFGDGREEDFRRSFDVVRPYKLHYVTDLARPVWPSMSRTHRRNATRALSRVHVEVCADPPALLDAWTTLYDQLVARHAISGIRRFSRGAFARQLSVPGLVMFKATAGGDVIGLHLWYVQGDVAYGHLGATGIRGYELMASYALYWHAITCLRERVRWLDLGGSPDGVAGDGLRRFKAGWATSTRQTYLCGRVFRPDAYAHLVAGASTGGSDYFPAYRRGEFINGRPQRTVASAPLAGPTHV